jgi:hypothetical protein
MSSRFPPRATATGGDGLSALLRSVEAHQVSRLVGLPLVSTDLDADQRQAVDAPERTVRIIAPAGAGKTHCMVNRVLVAMRASTPPERILLLTFDRNAKGELKARLDRVLGERRAPACLLSTHSARSCSSASVGWTTGRRSSRVPRQYAMMRPIVDGRAEDARWSRRPAQRRRAQGLLGAGVAVQEPRVLRRPRRAQQAEEEVAYALSELPGEVRELLFRAARC